jgi:hypothetical protein
MLNSMEFISCVGLFALESKYFDSIELTAHPRHIFYLFEPLITNSTIGVKFYGGNAEPAPPVIVFEHEVKEMMMAVRTTNVRWDDVLWYNGSGAMRLKPYHRVLYYCREMNYTLPPLPYEIW